MNATTHEMIVNSRSAPELIDVTPLVQTHVTASGIQMGIAVVFSQHTTAAIIVNEGDPGLHRDIVAMLERLAPEHGQYDHNGPGGEQNGHAHLRQVLLGSSVSLPVVGGKLALGTWQRIYFVELDVPRE